MKRPSKPSQDSLREKIIGLGERSIRKSYYPELYRRIEELEVARAELAESQARYRTLVENINDVIFSLDTKGRITYVSPVVHSLAGFTPEEVTGHHFAGFVHGDDVSELLGHFHNAVAGQTEFSEFRLRNTAGAYLHVRVSLRPMHDKGVVSGVTGIVADITKRKEAEIALKKSYQELEQRVAERTADLERMKNDAMEANARKSWFVAAASHDLRQPLQAALAFLAVLSQKLVRSEMREISEKIRRPLKAMSDILDVLLDIADLETGQVEPKLQDFPLQEVFQRVTASTQYQAQAKDLAFHCPPTHLMVHSDPKLLERVLTNFVANAIRYTEEGRIGIRCEPMGSMVRISVTDTGIGIPADALEMIFEDHVQLGNPARDRRMGLGLGLSIAKRIAETLGHRISVQSELGSGSSFSIDLPQAEAALAPLEPEPPALSQEERPVVLLIDDDRDVADSMQTLLRFYRFDTYMAQNREAALAMLNTGLKPGLVLCDYRLSGVNGIDLIAQLRKVLHAMVPAILMTGDTGLTETDLPHCLVLHKPIDIDALLAAIGTVMRRPVPAFG